MKGGDVMDLKPKTPMVLMMHHSMHAQYLNVLTLLYQPIIGVEALSTYLTLASLNQSSGQSLTHHHLIQLLGNSVERFVKQRQKLEAVGLLQTFEDEQADKMTYLLLPPLSASRFFSDGIINVFLSLKIGHADYQLLRQRFLEKEPITDGVNVSKSFNEVFDTSVLSRQVPGVMGEAPVTPEKTGPSLDVAFDETLMASLLKQFGIDHANLSPKVIEQLNKVAFLYKLDEHELARLVFDALDVDGFVNLDAFRRLAKQYFQMINKGKPVSVKEVEPQTQSQAAPATVAQSKEAQLIEFLSQTNPIDFLKHKSHQKEPVPADRQLVEWLVVDQQMPYGVVNVLIDYVLKVSKGRLPKTLVEKIAGEWQRKNINDTQTAIAHAKEAVKPKEPSSPKMSYGKAVKPIRQEQLPDWFTESKKEPKQEMTQPSEDALNKIEQMKRLQEQLLFKKG